MGGKLFQVLAVLAGCCICCAVARRRRRTDSTAANVVQIDAAADEVTPPVPEITLAAGDGLSLSITVENDNNNTSAIGNGNPLRYSLALDGKIWLRSGPVAITVDGQTYHSESSSCAPHCLVLQTTGGSNTHPNITHGSDVQGSYRELVYKWITTSSSSASSSTPTFTSSISNTNPTSPSSSSMHSSSSSSSTTTTTSTTTSARGVPFLTAFRVYTSVPVVVFEQRFPDGVANASFSGTSPHDAAKTINTAFPSWIMGNATKNNAAAGSPAGEEKSASASTSTSTSTSTSSSSRNNMGGDESPLSVWTSRDQSAGVHSWGGSSSSSSSSSSLGGGIGGGSPLVLFNPQRPRRSLVMSPLDNFMAGALDSPCHMLATSTQARTTAGNINADNSSSRSFSAGGVLGSVARIPVGYVHPTVVVGGLGVASALMDWGNVLLRRSGKSRTRMHGHPTDLSLTHIGYWTDHGGWYHYLCSECCTGAGAEAKCPCPPECAGNTTMEDVMLKVKADFEKRGIPHTYFMFDSWWYPKVGDPGANATHPWPVRSGEGMLSWTPEPQVFQSGTKDWLHLPTFLHARYLAPQTIYRDVPELAQHMICEETPAPSPHPPSPPAPPSPPLPPCHSGSNGVRYCGHPGVYCAGANRRMLLEQENETLDGCQALCLAQSSCNCVSWARNFARTGKSDCRAYAHASELVKSGLGFDAYVRASSTIFPSTNGRVAAGPTHEGQMSATLPGLTQQHHHRGGSSSSSRNNVALPSSNGVCLPVDDTVFLHMMTGVSNWQPFLYEQDWISATYQKSTSLINSTTTGEQWLGGMDRAASQLNMTIQFSMSYTPAILQSSKMQALTQIRGSGDYSCGSDQWKVGNTAMLYWALGAVASKDTFFTEKHQPGCPDAGHYNCTEPNVEVQVIMATLAGGPVGPSDRLGLTNKTLTMRACDAGGRILRPDRPLAVLDRAFEGAPENVPVLWSTFSSITAQKKARALNISSSAAAAASLSSTLTTPLFPAAQAQVTYHTVFYQGTESITLFPSDLLSPCGNTTISAQHCGAAKGPDAVYAAAIVTETGGIWPPPAQSVQVVTATSPLELSPPPAAQGKAGDGVVPFQYVVLAPCSGQNGGTEGSNWVVFGELDKVMPVSAERFSDLLVSSDSSGEIALDWRISGAPGESVHVSWAVVKEYTVRTSTCILGSEGTANFSCQSGSGCGCDESVL